MCNVKFNILDTKHFDSVIYVTCNITHKSFRFLLLFSYDAFFKIDKEKSNINIEQNILKYISWNNIIVFQGQK